MVLKRTRERQFRTTFRRKLEAIPGSFWESVQQVAIRGTADIIGTIRGKFVALELKASATAPIEPLQIIKLERIRNAGGVGRIVFPENAEEILEELWKLSN